MSTERDYADMWKGLGSDLRDLRRFTQSDIERWTLEGGGPSPASAAASRLRSMGFWLPPGAIERPAEAPFTFTEGKFTFTEGKTRVRGLLSEVSAEAKLGMTALNPNAHLDFELTIPFELRHMDPLRGVRLLSMLAPRKIGSDGAHLPVPPGWKLSWQ